MPGDESTGAQSSVGTTATQMPPIGLRGRDHELGVLSRAVDDLGNGVRSHRSTPASPRSTTARSAASARTNRTTRGTDRGVTDATQPDCGSLSRDNDLRR
jgi:hypothetical protein